MVQYGRYHESIDVTIFVYSDSTLTWKCTLQNVTITPKTNLTKQLIVASIYGRNISLKRYIVSLRIKLLEETDFTNYTFVSMNSNGSKNCTVSATAKGKFIM